MVHIALHPSSISTCTSNAFLIAHLNYSYSFITGHVTCTFSSFHLICLLSGIDMMTNGCLFLVGISVSEKPFNLVSYNLLGIASRVWVVLFFLVLLKYYSSPYLERVVGLLRNTTVGLCFLSFCKFCEFIPTDTFHCLKYLLADPFRW